MIVRHARLIAALLFLAVLLVAGEASGLREHLNLAYLKATIEAHWLSGLALFVLLFVLGNLLHIPGFVFLAAAVLALGQVWGGVATYVAAVAACIVTYLAARMVGGDALRQLKSTLARRIFRHLDAWPVLSIVALRVVFQTLPAVNYALGLSGVGFRRYLTGTLLGLPLPIALYCVFFEYLAGALHLV